MIAMIGVAQNTAMKWQKLSPPEHTDKQIKALQAFSGIMFIISVLYVCFIVYIRKSLNIAIKCLTMAATALEEFPTIVFTPILHLIGFVLFMIPFMFYCFNLASDG